MAKHWLPWRLVVRYPVLNLGLLVCFYSTVSLAISAKVFECTIPVPEENAKGEKVDQPVKIKFALSGLQKGGARHLSYQFLSEKDQEEWNAVVIESEEDRFGGVGTLNDNYSVRPVYPTKEVTVKAKGKKPAKTIKVSDRRKTPVGFELFGDGDGVDYAYLRLFKNSGYQEGYFRFTADDKSGSYYRKIHCEVEDKDLTEFDED